jgi:hypothetical protein
MKMKLNKIDFSLIVEVVGISLVTSGLAMISLPAAFIVLGSFLIWITEKAN